MLFDVVIIGGGPAGLSAGDVTTRMQAAVAAVASGMQTGAMINFELAMELASNASFG